MKRFAVVAVVLATAACAGDNQTEGQDTVTPSAGAVEAPAPAAATTDSAVKADSAKADSAKADSAAKAAAKTKRP